MARLNPPENISCRSAVLPCCARSPLSPLIAASSHAIAQQSPTPSRVRGTIEAVNGDVLAVKSRAGEDVKLHMTGDMKVVGITKISLADIKVGSFIGTTTVPGPDGSQNAVEVHVFPEDMRGTGEGSRPYDLRPNSTMTNATVATDRRRQ